MFITTTYAQNLGKKAFSYNASYTWNKLQQDLNLCSLTGLKGFKQILRMMEKALLDGCSCSYCFIATVFYFIFTCNFPVIIIQNCNNYSMFKQFFMDI